MNTDLDPARAANLDQLCINTLRFLAVDAIQEANSGHPGMPMGAAPMAYLLWTRFLRHNPASPQWFDRDRFVLSAGHGSMLLYSLLHLTGYDLPLSELKRFRQWGSLTPGHPERGVTPGVELTTGPLGQGFGNAVGMAIAESHLAARYNRPGFELVDHFTYVLAGDGDLMEGVAAEAASLAGHLRLGKLICLYDDNRITLAASTDLSFTEDRGARFRACGWQVLEVSDGNDLEALGRALEEARGDKERPSLVMVRTRIGFGSPQKQDSFEAHGAPLGVEEVRRTKDALGWPQEPRFHVPPEALARFREAVEAGAAKERAWESLMAGYAREYPAESAELKLVLAGELPQGWQEALPVFPADAKGMATRAASAKVLNALAQRVPQLIGGSADLNPSTLTALAGRGDFQSEDFEPGDRQGAVGGTWGRAGANLHFGVREHAMGAILNGMAAHGGTLPFGATFLTFSDYLRPALRLAALSRLKVIHIFTHDSIALGEDGPTHQPVEQLASLRAIPNLVLLRPGDANECAAAWRAALQIEGRPVALVLSRQAVPTLDREALGGAAGVLRGGYVLAEARGVAPRLILIATGSELSLALAARTALEEGGIPVRVVSLPSWELFDEQPEEYRDLVLPPQVTARLAIEAGSSQGWHRYVGSGGGVLSVDGFGASAPGDVVLKEYGFTVDRVCDLALGLVQGAAPWGGAPQQERSGRSSPPS
ncbi:Transketolase [Citrifermentans bremense]|uniref:Transketolase n=1 Tax=Citrifermentans bremense TaxID=60035 RepID=A0A6S6M0Z8_9BACT|nr:transketolase [Citrifermentans bremense]BCG47997.1 Transketolase [Citrifermentans bremense]